MSDPRLFRTISDYLCTECKTPLYLEVGSKDKNGVCPNRRCILHMPTMKFYDLTRAGRLKEEMRTREEQLRVRITRTNQFHFVNYLYNQRLDLIKSLHNTSKVDFRRWLAIDDLLIYVSSNSPRERQSSIQTFESILSDYCEHFDKKCSIEDVANERYLISVDKKPYVLKYWPALLRFYEAYGIIAGTDKPISGAFQYSDIEKQVKEKLKFRFGEDWGRSFQQMFDFIIALGYMFEYQYFTAKQHRYDPTGVDIAALIGLSMSSWQEVEAWSCEGIKRHFDLTSKGQESFDEFYEKYVSGHCFAPVIVFDGKKCLFDKYTTLVYSLYLIGRNQRMSPDQTRAGARDIAARREEASNIFADRVRQQLMRAGYVVPDKALKVREQNEEHEFDVVGIHEAKSKLVIAEAKYRDFAPSSISGKTLVKQELLDDDMLLDWASDTQSKLEFFRRHGARFERLLSLGKSVNYYDVSAWVITKHTPLISKYRGVQIVDFWEFCGRLT